MKKSVLMTVCMLTAALVSAPVWAQDGEGAKAGEGRRGGAREGRPARERPEGAEGRRGGDRDPLGNLQKALAKLELNEETAAKVAEIVNAAKADMEAFQKQMQELRQKMQQAERGSDEQKAAMEKMRELAQSQRGKGQDLFKKLGEVLSEEQMAALKAAMRPEGRGEAGDRLAQALGLTDEQKAKVAEAQKAAMEKAREAEGDKRKVYREAMQEQLKTILSQEQMDKYNKLMEGRGGRGEGERPAREGRREGDRPAREGRRGEGRRGGAEKDAD